VVGLDLAGISRPVVLLPQGILERLTPAHLEAVLAHEFCHVRRRDNLTAALHMIVEAVFWNPLVWWIGERLAEERERVCDAGVLRLGNEAQVYAESILRVCQFYVDSPLACVSGVTGSDLKKRMAGIMNDHFGETLGTPKKILLAAASATALAMPLAWGLLTAPRLRAQAPHQTALRSPTFRRHASAAHVRR
jgi:bla regulator protein blaR1